MRDYVLGTTVLGADAFGPPSPIMPTVMFPLEMQRQQQAQAQFDANQRRGLAMVKGSIIGGAVGFLALGTGGAILWPAHRIIGFLLGSLVGGAVGAPVGAALSAGDSK